MPQVRSPKHSGETAFAALSALGPVGVYRKRRGFPKEYILAGSVASEPHVDEKHHTLSRDA